MALADINLVSNTYAGDKLAGIISDALLPKNGLAERGLVTVLDNVKKKRVVRKLDIDVELADPSADFSGATGDLGMDETVLDLVKYEFHKDLDLNALYTTWEAAELRAGSLNDGEPPADFMEWIENAIATKLGIANSKLYTLGKAGTSEATFTASYAGILANIEAASASNLLSANYGEQTISGITTADPGVVTVGSTSDLNDGDFVTLVGTDGNQQYDGATIEGQSFQISVLSSTTFSLGVEITGATPATEGFAQFINEGNVITHMSNVYRQIPEAVRPMAKILVPQHVSWAYKLATAAPATGSGAYYVGDRTLDFLGNALEEMNHWTPNNIAVWDPANVFLGVDVLGEDSMLRILDMRDKTNEDKIRIKAAMKSDIKAGYYGEIVMLRPEDVS